jgi:hypothetical protein
LINSKKDREPSFFFIINNGLFVLISSSADFAAIESNKSDEYELEKSGHAVTAFSQNKVVDFSH